MSCKKSSSIMESNMLALQQQLVLLAASLRERRKLDYSKQGKPAFRISSVLESPRPQWWKTWAMYIAVKTRRNHKKASVRYVGNSPSRWTYVDSLMNEFVHALLIPCAGGSCRSRANPSRYSSFPFRSRKDLDVYRSRLWLFSVLHGIIYGFLSWLSPECLWWWSRHPFADFWSIHAWVWGTSKIKGPFFIAYNNDCA